MKAVVSVQTSRAGLRITKREATLEEVEHESVALLLYFNKHAKTNFGLTKTTDSIPITAYSYY